MSKIHYFQRYSARENVVTNNTLHLFARIYSYSPTRLSWLLSELVDEAIELGIEMRQQVTNGEAQKKGKSYGVPDGSITQSSFKLLIEAKVTAPPSVSQLLKHAESFQGESQRILLLLTTQKLTEVEAAEFQRLITDQHAGVTFRNVTYEDVCDAARGLFKEHEDEMIDLVDDYTRYCAEERLFDPSPYLMRVVPCGKSLQINRRHGVYFAPSDHGYTRHAYVGIYANKRVRFVWKLDSVFDVRFENGKLEKVFVEGRDTSDYDQAIVASIHEAKEICGYNIAKGCRFFCGRPIATNYVKASSGGLMGARFINLRKVFGTTELGGIEDIAERLTNKEWH